MNLTKLRNEQIRLIKFLQEGGYSKSHIYKTKAEIKHLLDFGENYNSYLDYYKKYVILKYTDSTQKNKKGILTMIMNFDLYDKLPDRNHFDYKLIDNSKYSILNTYFKKIINIYKKEATIAGKKKTTIHIQSSYCILFFVYLQSKDCESLKDANENDVLNFFLDKNGNLKYSHTYETSIRVVLKTCIPYFKECKTIINFLPNIRSGRKNIDYLTNEEIDSIKDVLNNKDSHLSLRDKALVTILLYTGLRGCDIANLKLTDIDWSKEIISIVQSKTEVPLDLPLTTSVGNSIFEYIKKERPKVHVKNIFIREDANYPITTSSIQNAVKKVFKEANIRQEGKKRKGTHIFRYNLATSLLKNEIPGPIISQVLGHESPNSLNFYLNADFYHLKEYSLSIECFENLMGVCLND